MVNVPGFEIIVGVVSIVVAQPAPGWHSYKGEVTGKDRGLCFSGHEFLSLRKG
jgi:hypothetical protein